MNKKPTPVEALAGFLIAQGLDDSRLGKTNTIVFRYGSASADWMNAANLAFDYMWSRGANPTIAQIREMDDGKLEHQFEFDQDPGLTQSLFTEIQDAVQKLRGIAPAPKARLTEKRPSTAIKKTLH